MRIKSVSVSIFKVLAIIVLVAVVALSCNKKDEEAPCSNSGTPVNIGSTTGGGFSQAVSPDLICSQPSQYTTTVTYKDYVGFDNTSLNFSCGGDPSSAAYCSGVSGTIMDVGAQTCPASCSGTPTASTVAYTSGHGYVGKFADGHTVKFITGTYSGGSVLINYIFQ